MKEKIIFKTEDGKSIAAEIYSAKNEPVKGWIIFSHMMPATKESWKEFAEELSENGYSSITYDFRGHGESDSGTRGYLEFTDAEHQNYEFDLESAIAEIENRGAKDNKIFLIGASIGANVSFRKFASDEKISKVVLFSPGLNYHGVETQFLNFSGIENKSVYFISAKDDDGNDKETEILFQVIPQNIKKEISIFDSGGHGTEILENQPTIKKLILEFLNK